MAQSGRGRVQYHEDFFGAEIPVANTNTTDKIGALRVIGDGLADTDGGIVNLESDGLSGVAQLTSTDEDKHGIYVSTPIMFDVALMGTLIAEARVRFPAVANREAFFGFTDINANDLSLEDDMLHGTATTLSYTATNLAGFLFSSELTDAADWHMVHTGGTATAPTTSGDVDADEDATAGEYQVLRLIVYNNGTVEWWIDGALKQSKATAVSLTTDMALVLGFESKTTTSLTFDIDYVEFSANRDWTV